MFFLLLFCVFRACWLACLFVFVLFLSISSRGGCMDGCILLVSGVVCDVVVVRVSSALHVVSMLCGCM